MLHCLHCKQTARHLANGFLAESGDIYSTLTFCGPLRTKVNHKTAETVLFITVCTNLNVIHVHNMSVIGYKLVTAKKNISNKNAKEVNGML